MRKFNGDKEENVQVLSNGPIPEVDLSAGESAGIRGSALRNEEPVVVEPPKWFRVIKGGIVLEGGFRTRMKEGKEINTLNYNVRKLQQQGIVLQEFDPAEVVQSFYPNI